MTDKIKEKLEDLTIAILLTKTDIRQTENGRSLFFTLKERKVPILRDYLQRYQLKQQVAFDESSLTGYIAPSIMLEGVLRSWTLENRVSSINPLALGSNAYYLWISLFAEKAAHGVVIPSDLDPDVQHTLTYLFNQQFGVSLYRGSLMQIRPFSPIMLKAIKSNRPIEESMELSYLLPLVEKEEFKTLITEWEEERSNYAY
ncbi:hypothetical protein [Cytobacillus gottheilii]|uniref:hypothetical protein n=1 Tax=Cytobacillus gottheilii TaxID=859144 RepID=UPI0024941D70|nr:hypothetical protein [Cytobacillus gottheilii]